MSVIIVVISAKRERVQWRSVAGRLACMGKGESRPRASKAGHL